MIYQALGMQEGDLLLLCTDGVTYMITETEIEEILIDKMIQNKVEIIVDRVMEKGGKDNITALVEEVLL